MPNLIRGKVPTREAKDTIKREKITQQQLHQQAPKPSTLALKTTVARQSTTSAAHLGTKAPQ